MDTPRFIRTATAGGLLGAAVFWLYQIAFQGGTITAFIGGQIVSQGKYPLPPSLVGWAVHLGVSLSYAGLLALILQFPFSSSEKVRRGASLAIALALGWATTKIAPPAIQITISLLSRKGFPSPLWELNEGAGHPLWNHLLFFALVWAVDLLGASRAALSLPAVGGGRRWTA